MKTKILFAGLLFAGLSQLHAQSQVETSNETGYGLENGAARSAEVTPGVTHIGYRAGYANTGKGNYGPNNTFVGNQSGYNTTNGYENVFLGGFSGFSNTTGRYNTFTGYQSGYLNTAGVQNVFMGRKAGYNNTTGNNNIFIGFNAGLNNIGGDENAFTGAYAGQDNTTGDRNTFYGFNSGKANTTGLDNTFIGVAAGSDGKTAKRNTCIGIQTGRVNNGKDNVFVGHAPGFNNTGSENTMLGAFSGFNNITGSGNVFIGNKAGMNETLSNKLYMSNSDTTTPMIYGDFTTGKVGIGGIDHDYSTADNFPATAGSADVSAYKLFVKGGILTEEVRVNLQTGWADYVFANDYNLTPLAEVEKFIAENGHLPNVPSAQRVKEDGIELGQMANIQQEKIEELTLYAIAQNKQIEAQKAQLEKQQQELDELKAAVKALAEKQ